MSRKQISVLLIDDDPNAAASIRKMLSGFKPHTCTVEAASSVDGGLKRIGCGGIDIVLLSDVENDVLERLRILRGCSPFHVPILVIGKDDPELALKAVHGGAQDYLIHHEFDARSLLRSIEYSIERQETRGALRDALAEVERTKEALRQSERKFRAIFDHTFQLMGLLTPDGTLIQANRTALDFVGVGEGDVLGKRFWDTPWWSQSPDQRERLRAGIVEAVAGKFVRFKTTHQATDGTLHYFDFSLKPVIDESGRVILIIPEGRDVTEQEHIEKALWESSQRLKLVLDHMPSFVFWKDRNSVYMGCNHLFAANAGFKSAEEIIGLTDMDLPWKETEAESYRADDRAVMESGIPKLNYEETQFTAGGRLTYVRTSKVPLRNPEGEIIGVLGTFEDITERRKAEQKLSEAEAKYRCLVEGSLVGVYLIQRGRFAYVNSCMAQLFGYTQQELIGRPIDDLVFVDDRAIVAGNVRKRERGDFQTLQYTFRGLRKDGQIIDVEVMGTGTIYDGNPAVIGSLLDITERKRADKILRESEAKYRRIVDTAREGILAMDADGLIRFANARMAEILGYSTEELLSRSPTEFFFAEDRSDHEERVKRCRQGISENYERRFRRKDGETVWTIASAVPLFDDEHHFIGSFAMFSDITQRKAAEEALQEERMLFIGGPAVAFRWNASEGWPIEYVSPNVLQQFQYRPEELANEFRYHSLVHPEDLRRLNEEIRAYSDAKVPCFEQEYRIRRADGEYRWVYDFTVAIRDAAGTITHYHGHISDITERKRAEEEQARLRKHLQQAQKMEAVGHLAGGIAHDFNNILGIINGYSELLLQENYLQQDTRERISEILAAGERAASLTRQLLAFSRRLVLKPKVLSLNTIISGLDKMLRRLIGEEIEVETRLAPDLSCVKADPGQMEQVILNFCINARDAMPEGGTITIETANVHVDEYLASEHFNMTPGPYVRVSVSDTGTGMSKETLSHIFEPFFTTKGPDRGTGLGLATVYGIVQQSGGHVWAASEPGGGSTFFVYLPVAAEEQDQRGLDPPSRQVARGSETILLVEDSAPLRALFRMLLEKTGYTVLESENGEKALQIANDFSGTISLLLTDVSLPKIKGSALARMLLQRRPGLKVLLVSGHTDTAIAPDGVLDPGTAFLQKPFTGEALVEKIRELLDFAPGKLLPFASRSKGGRA